MKHLFNFSALLLVTICVCIVNSCDDKDFNLFKEKVSGKVQKGPYINGTAIVMSELNASLEQTGNVFNTQITDNRGTFELNNIGLSSSFVEFSANGYFFNEIQGKISAAPLQLFALSDIRDLSTINLNILTHLEKRRVENLIDKGETFEQAKILAQNEILAIFGFVKDEMQNSESLDITVYNDDNAILIAISLILQGNLSVGVLTELLATISEDLHADGILSNEQTLIDLRYAAKKLKLTEIRSNLEKRYQELGISIDIADFEKYIQQFLNFTSSLVDPRPVVSFFADDTVIGEGEIVFFTDSSENNPTSWFWDFGDNEVSEEQHPNHQYFEPGKYNVSLSASNKEGTDVLVKEGYITVVEDLPIAKFDSENTLIEEGDSIRFYDQSLNEPTAWLWDFGDTSTSNEQFPIHKYALAGTYSVALTVTNTGGSDTETKIDYITVTPPPAPQADFSVSRANTYPDVLIQFSDASQYMPTQWLWSFGDGHSSIEKNPQHTYVSTGTYSVSLTVSNSGGTDKKEIIDLITIQPVPENCVLNTITGRVWMDKNLGSQRVALSSDDSEAYGDLYQWGRDKDGHEKRNSGTITTTATQSAANLGNEWDGLFIINRDFWYHYFDSTLWGWKDFPGSNNPCPDGFKVPSQQEWEEEIDTWNSLNASGAYSSPLKLTLSGYRDTQGNVTDEGKLGYYWSRDPEWTNHARSLYFGSNGTIIFEHDTANHGNSIRCIKTFEH